MAEMWAIMLMIIGTFFAAAGSLLLKKGSEKIKNIRTLLPKNLIIGIIIYVISAILFIIALKGGELSILYPIASLDYIWTCFLAKKYLGEKINTYKWTGVFIIVIGISLIIR